MRDLRLKNSRQTNPQIHKGNLERLSNARIFIAELIDEETIHQNKLFLNAAQE